MAIDKVRSLELFLSAIDHGSFAAAAIHCETSPSTISKSIGRLEEDLGIQLFQRTTRQLRLTGAGLEYAAKVRDLLEELDNCERSLQKGNDAALGVLRVNVPVSFGRLYVRPMLSAFHKKYPDIQLEISYDDKYVDIIENDIDVCIRSGTVADSRLIVRQISPIDFLICASPKYLKRIDKPITSRDFSKHPWIRFRFAQTNRLMPIMVPSRGKTRHYDPDRSFIVDDGEALSELCADHLGLTQMPHFIARNWIQSKKIVPVMPAYHPDGFGVFILYPKRNYLPARVRVFIDHVIQTMEKSGEYPTHTWARELDTWPAL